MDEFFTSPFKETTKMKIKEYIRYKTSRSNIARGNSSKSQQNFEKPE